MTRGRKPRVFTPKEEEFIISHYKKLSYRVIGEKLNTSRDIVRVWCKENGYTLTCAERKLKQGNSLQFIPKFSKKELQFIQDNYLAMSKGSISRKLRCSIQRLNRAFVFLRIEVPEEIIEERRKRPHPLGKGLPQEKYFGEKGVQNSLPHRFKKGNKEYLKRKNIQNGKHLLQDKKE